MTSDDELHEARERARDQLLAGMAAVEDQDLLEFPSIIRTVLPGGSVYHYGPYDSIEAAMLVPAWLADEERGYTEVTQLPLYPPDPS